MKYEKRQDINSYFKEQTDIDKDIKRMESDKLWRKAKRDGIKGITFLWLFIVVTAIASNLPTLFGTLLEGIVGSLFGIVALLYLGISFMIFISGDLDE